MPATDASVLQLGSSMNIPVSLLLANDSDLEDDPLSPAGITVAAETNGTPSVVVNDGGTPGDPSDDTYFIHFEPPPGFLGIATFIYTFTDSGGLTDSATVTVNIALDLTVDLDVGLADDDDPEDEDAIPEEEEEPGLLVNINENDDNENDEFDRLDTNLENDDPELAGISVSSLAPTASLDGSVVDLTYSQARFTWTGIVSEEPDPNTAPFKLWDRPAPQSTRRRGWWRGGPPSMTSRRIR